MNFLSFILSFLFSFGVSVASFSGWVVPGEFVVAGAPLGASTEHRAGSIFTATPAARATKWVCGGGLVPFFPGGGSMGFVP